MGACQDLMKELEVMILIKDIGNLANQAQIDEDASKFKRKYFEC
jgi:hypothetical protein